MLKDAEEIDKMKSDEFKGLKKNKEELLPGSYNTEAIKGVQSFLNNEGFTDKNGDELKTDGLYGANTANAVMKYQRANNLSVDGIVGDETWGSIYNKKKKREEDALSKNSYFDVWRQKYNPFKENKAEYGEDFHERVRKGWESRTLPERKAGFTEVKAQKDAFPVAPPPMPERYIAKAESPKEAEGYTSNSRGDYYLFDEKGGKGTRTAGMSAHSRFLPDSFKKNGDKLAEKENSYHFLGSERTNESFGEYDSAREFYSADISNKKVNPTDIEEADVETLVEKYGGIVARDYRTSFENGFFPERKLRFILIKIGDKVKVYSDEDFSVFDESKPYGEKIYVDEEKLIVDFDLDVVTKEQLTQLGWKNVDDNMIKELNSVLRKYHIVTKEELCHFLSQVSAESECGLYLTELYDGSPDEYFSGVSGGSKYRGAGYIQLTHDYTYRDFANYVGDPDILNKGYSYVAENYPWEAAAWFWSVYKNNLALHQKAKDGASVEAITKIVNGGYNGLEKRKKYYELAKSIFMGE